MRADVGVAAAGLAVLERGLPSRESCQRPPAQWMWSAQVVHQAVEMRVEVLAEHPLEVGAGDDVEEVRDHAVGDERLAVVVEVEAPGIGGAVGDDLEDLAGRVIAPDAAVDRHALARRACRACRRCELERMPLQPQSQPSGPQFRALNMLCWALMSQPSSDDRAGRRAGRRRRGRG